MGRSVFEGPPLGLRARRGWVTSPVWGTYVYLFGTTYRLGLHDVPLEGLVQVRRVFRGTSAEPPPPRPTPPSGRGHFLGLFWRQGLRPLPVSEGDKPPGGGG